MSAVAAASPVAGLSHHVGVARQVRLMARRSVSRTLRQPALFIPVVSFPLILMAVNAAGLSSVTKLPGFPTDRYVNFAVVVCFMQGALFAAITAGTELAGDISRGFIDRLSLTPASRVAVLLGSMAGAIVVALGGTVLYTVVGVLFGVTFQSGLLGALVLIVLAMYIAIAFIGLGAVMALVTGSAEAVQGLFPLLFVLLFLSTMSLPREFIEQDWFRTIATWNPLSYLIDGMRSLIITGWDAGALAAAFGTATAILVLSYWWAARLLRTRMTRT
jgi:ABC-2 type transport system permease protein